MNTRFWLFLLFSACLFSCKRKYTVEGDKVYYHFWNEGSGSHKWLLDSADGKSFESVECDCNFVIGKDKRHVYMNGVPISGMDPHTFSFIGNYIFRDKDSAYFFGFYNNIQNCRIHNVNPDRIKLLEYPWAKADNILIHGYDTLLLNDVANFVPIDKNWGKTKKYVIYRNKILEDADPETFKVINSGYTGKDKKHIYQSGKIKEYICIQL
jgi:hypothetical protein